MNKILKLFLIFQCTCLFSQDTIYLNLDDAIKLAQDSSIMAFKAKNMLLIRKLNYINHLSQTRPSLNLSTTPLDYHSSFTKRYDYENNKEVYRHQQDLSGSSRLFLNQPLIFTDGNIFIDSDFGYIHNYTDDTQDFFSTPLRIGIEIPLLSYNKFKWDRIIEPKQYNIAKKEFIKTTEEIAQQAIILYFDMLEAKLLLDQTIEILQNAKSLYSLGKKRFKIAGIYKDDLLTLQLDYLNAKEQRKKQEITYFRVKQKFLSFLRLPFNQNISLSTPQSVPSKNIKPNKALEIGIENNPDLTNYKIELLKANANIEKINKQRYEMELYGSYGLNQNGNTVPKAYKNLMDQQIIGLSVQIPITTWGYHKGQKKLAIKQKELIALEYDQQKQDFHNSFLQTIMEFNIQPSILENAQIADTIAHIAYEMSLDRFKIGQIDLANLKIKRVAMLTARRNYIDELRRYWIQYYLIRSLTLYDFIENLSLKKQYDEMLQ